MIDWTVFFLIFKPSMISKIFICKIIFVLSHGQSDVERGFSVNKEILQDNLQEKYLISQRLIHNTIHSAEQKLHDCAMSHALCRSFKSAYLNYKIAFDKAKEDKEKRKFIKAQNSRR